ncbi:fungal-specific transcription factor domain-containing protein [Aspergillus pseudotamarii]|uniref:Fungal-specific transcription factor domain-containing protein n=1 Tax=Aspergillus pseudotamarii TaxID=132259 RepID=A0A5N6SW44_ASPPS|nr:fungal-specific transcription factor domain-containing protein [Aspergillus pseudotamarii]KAE8138885.1 fungal-specific transcription factor domain-containing protein [Aspergillus pseudotamarii]
MSENVSPPAPRRRRRGMPRSVAACQRCRRRKQKCDGIVPTCGPCAAVSATCIMSGRLMIQQTNLSAECVSLRSQLAAAEQRGKELYNKCHQLETKISNILVSSRPVISGISSPGGSLVAQTVSETISQSDQVRSNPDNRLTSRILTPTFSIKSNLRGVHRGAMSSAWELWGDDTDTEVPEVSASDLNSDAYFTLANEFFDRRWPYLPILHRKSFFDNHLTPFLTKSDMKPLSNFLVNIVCAIASTEKPARSSSQIGYRVLFREAVKDLHLVMSSENFDCIQCLLLLCMYGHNEPQSVNMWYTTGLSLNLAISIDLHRKESISELNIKEAEMCKRVFWSAYVMGCSVAINMARPLGIRESDISMPLPLQMTDTQLDESIQSPYVEQTLIPSVADTSTFIHIIKLRRINAAIYTVFHSIKSTLTDRAELDRLRSGYFMELNQWLTTAPRYVQTLSTFQSTEWFQIAFHHAVLSLYRPSRAVPMPSSDDLRLCTESSIGLISSYSALYARNRIKYTFVAIHSLFMAALTMLYSLRASAPIRRELSKGVIKTNILTFLNIFRGISDGRMVGEKCCAIVERLGDSILSLFENENQADVNIDIEFLTWFGLQMNTSTSQMTDTGLTTHPQGSPPHFPDVQVDLPWVDLFTDGIDMGAADIWSTLF